MTDERAVPIRILSLAPTSFFNDYGCHVRILEEARALQALGHEVTVVTYYKGKDVPGLRVIRTSPTPWRPSYEVGSSRHKFVFDLLLSIQLFRVLAHAALRREQFDVIHGHLHEGALIGGALGRLFRVPVCFDFQGSLTDEMIMHHFIKPDTVAHRAFKLVERTANALPQAIVTSTRHAADTLRGSVRAATPVAAMPDGVNTQACRPDVLDPAARAEARARHGLGPDDVAVVFLGLLARHQGIQNLIDAAALLKARGDCAHVKWLVMGYPNEHVWRAAAAAAGVGDVMAFTGRVPYEQMPQMLALGDIAVAPKLSLTEGSGKILNYMALALPTVAFDTPAQREILGALGVYAPLGDTAELAERVRELAGRPQRRAELGEQLRQRARQLFSWERAAVTLMAVYDQILPRRRAAAPAAAPADPLSADDR
jgi:glycosyltransferase involved in cell wall biosynthesis